MINLFMVIVIINVIIGTVTIRKVTSYSMIHCIFIGVTMALPLMIKSTTVVLDNMAGWILELGLIAGGSSSKEIVSQFVAKYSSKDKAEKQGDK